MGMSESPQLVGMGSKMILFNSMTKLNRKNVQSLSPILHIKWYLNYQKSIWAQKVLRAVLPNGVAYKPTSLET